MPRIFASQLSAHLSSRLNRIYYLVGQELLLLDETKQAIIQTAQQQQFEEIYSLGIDNSTDWAALFERCQSRGLFFQRQIILLELPDSLTANLHQQLSKLISLLNQDILLILQFSKFLKTYEKQAWYLSTKQYDPDFLQINCQAPSFEQYPRWIAQRGKSLGLNLEQEAIQLLAYSYENNLLALKQTLQLFALLYGDRHITYAVAKEIVEQACIFRPYQWVDALFEGKEKRAKRILASLQQEDIQPVVLVRLLQRELMLLLQIAQPQQKIQLTDMLPQQHLKEQFDRLKIWQNRRPLFVAVLQRLNYQTLLLLFRQLASIERSIKQEFSATSWQQLAQISVSLCQGRLYNPLA